MDCTRDAFNADGSRDGDNTEFMESLMCAAGEFENQAELEENAEFENGFDEVDSDLDPTDSEFNEFDMDAYMAERERIERATSETVCVKAADHYMMEGGRWLEEWDILVEQLAEDSDEISDALEVVSWYLFQLTVKLRRAVSGKIEAEYDYMDDVYGSAKVVLIGADRSLDAWLKIQRALPAGQRDSLDNVIDILRDMIAFTEAEIPEARPFKRPGFDD